MGAQVLLQSGANPNRRAINFRFWRGRQSAAESTPLHLAAGYGSARTAQVMYQFYSLTAAPLNSSDALLIRSELKLLYNRTQVPRVQVIEFYVHAIPI